MLVAFAALGSQPTAELGSEEQSTAGLAVILENITGSTWSSTVLAAGAVMFAMGRDGLLPSLFAKVNPPR